MASTTINLHGMTRKQAKKIFKKSAIETNSYRIGDERKEYDYVELNMSEDIKVCLFITEEDEREQE